MITYISLLIVGVLAGILAGMFGLGGGVIIVPALIFIMKMKPIQAMATSLAALIPPVGLLGAIEYYRNWSIHVWSAALIAAGLFVGAYFGAKISIATRPDLLMRGYGVFLLLIAIRMIIQAK